MERSSSLMEENIKDDIIDPLKKEIKEFHESLDLPSLKAALKSWIASYEALVNKETKAKQVDKQYKTLIQNAQSSLSMVKDKQEKSNIRHTLRQELKNLESEHFALEKENLFKIGISLLEEAREKLTGQHIDYIVEYSGFSSSNQATLSSSPVLLQSEDILTPGKSISTSSRRITLQSILEGDFSKIFSQVSALKIQKTVVSSHNDYLNSLFEKNNEGDNFYRQSLAIFLNSKKGQRLARKNEGRFFEAVLHYANLLKSGVKRPSMQHSISMVDNLPYYSGPDIVFKEMINGQPVYRFLQAKLLGSATISFSTTYNGISYLSKLLEDIENINEQELENFLFGKSKENIKNTVDIIEQEARIKGIEYLRNVLKTQKFLKS